MVSASMDTPVVRDAVVVIPGIMGSELVDTATGATLWGLNSVQWYVRAWISGASLQALALTDDERAGTYGRVRATRLLRFPAFAPVLQGCEPYTRLLKAIRRVVVHPDAVAEFAYDWRLAVAHNGQLLAEFTQRHLAAWRRHPAYLAEMRRADHDRPAQIVIVAHSMGGLLARHLTLIDGATEDVKATVTLGTPFFGAPKAAVLLSSGRGAPVPLPRRRLRDLAATLPGVHDLLPVYRCVDVGPTALRLSPGDVGSLGGDRDLAAAAFEWQASVAGTLLPGHVQVVGAHQPTVQSLTLVDGVATGHNYTYRPRGGPGAVVDRVDLSGDGTVPRESAQLPPEAAMPLAQSHGAVAMADEALLVVADVLADQRTGPWLGTGELGLDLPDVVRAGTTFDVLISGVDHPRDAACRIVDVASERLVAVPNLVRADGRVLARVCLSDSGLYRVGVGGGGTSTVSQLLLALPADDVDVGELDGDA